MTGGDPRLAARWLWLLAGLFALRVAAQPAALALPVRPAWLPPFDSWHGGVVPYPVLLASQLLILWWLAREAWRISSGRLVPSRRAGMVALSAGAVYFGVMLVRFVLGLTVLRGHRWFGAHLPAFFHLVLAAYLLVYGAFHARAGR